jgi:UDPglucose 6-dehydrogenase
VLKVAETIGQFIQESRIIINKSTVPVGTADKVRQTVQAMLAKRQLQITFDVASNPEFLREGAAIEDFMNSDRIIIGTNHPETTEHLRLLYAPFNRNQDRLIAMDIRSAELSKYAANTFLAAKISLINELSNLAELLGADIEQVRLGVGSDPRIGRHFINAGCGYGGSCFPKDVRALERAAIESGYQAAMLPAIQRVNEQQKLVLFNKIKQYFNGNLRDKTIALWGLAFKPNTDDMREAPSRTLMEALWQAGAKVKAYDPVAMIEAARIYGQQQGLELTAAPEEALSQADALAIMTEWSIFSSPDFAMMKQRLRKPAVFDGRNLYDPKHMVSLGFDYFAIGRGNSLKS